MTIKVVGLELEVRVELTDGLPEGSAVPNHLTYSRLTVRLQQAFEGGRNNGHRRQWDVVLVDELHVGPRPATVLGRCSTFPACTGGVAASWVHRQYRFELEVTQPVIDKVVDVGKMLSTVQG